MTTISQHLNPNPAIDKVMADQACWQEYFDAKLIELKGNKMAWAAQVISTIGSLGRLLVYVTVFTVVFSALFLMAAYLLYGETMFTFSDWQDSLRTIMMFSMILSTMGCMAVNVGQFKNVLHDEARAYAIDVTTNIDKRQTIEYIVDEKLKALNLKQDTREDRSS